jgi:hypothetical protein
MKRHFSVRLAFALFTCGLLSNGFVGCGIAAPTTFTLDPAQSTITVTASLGSSLVLTEQAPGSLTTRFAGTIKADTTGSSIQFTGGSVIDAQTNGTWQPMANGVAGSAPADFGGRGSTILGSGNAALRNVVFDATSAVLSITNGAFSSAGVVFGFLTNGTASLDYLITGLASAQGGKALQGLSTNKVSTTATLTNSGSNLILTIPVNADFFFTLLSANDTKVTVTGKLVAIAAGAPPLLVSPSTVSVQNGMVSFQWQAAPGLTFRVEGSTDLQTWTTRQSGITSATSTHSWSGTALGTKEYFRLVQ